jgi:hypothetical protein
MLLQISLIYNQEIYLIFGISFCLTIITIDIIMRKVPIRWNIVKTLPKINIANKEVIIGVGAITIVALDTSRYERVLYQQNSPDP